MFIIVGAAAVVLKAFSKKEDSEKEESRNGVVKSLEKTSVPIFCDSNDKCWNSMG